MISFLTNNRKKYQVKSRYSELVLRARINMDVPIENS